MFSLVDSVADDVDCLADWGFTQIIITTRKWQTYEIFQSTTSIIIIA